MISTSGGDPPSGSRAPRATFDHYLEGKLSPPPRRERWVQRSRLVDAMTRATSLPVTLVAAPAGYGKTTMVAQWLQSQDRATIGWVSLDADDNDPDRLWAQVAAALEGAGCPLPVIEPSRVLGPGSAGTSRSVLPAIITALAAMPGEIVLVLDDFQFIQSQSCHDQVEALVPRLPAHAHLVIITRSDPGLRLGRLRVSSDLAEIRAADLAFAPEEARQLLEHEDVHLSDAAFSQLMERTEGWPAALYLATLSLGGRADPNAYVRSFSEGNRFIGDYLTEEVLSRHTARVRTFITRVSVLDRLSAALCDAVAGTDDSAMILHDLERDNLFLVPLDAERRWFRFHHLFAAVARSELELEHPDEVSDLHARAAEWFSAHAHVPEAIRHFLAAGRKGDAAFLVQSNWLTYADAGRAETVLSWLASLGDPEVPTDPAARVTAAWMAAYVADETALAGHLAALEGLGEVGPLPDGTRSVESAVALIDGMFGYGGPLGMLKGAGRAVELETDRHSPYYAVANVSLAHAFYVLGDLDRATAPLRAAALSHQEPGLVRVLGLCIQSFVEHEGGRLALSCQSAERAMDVVDAQELRASPQASLAFAALGQAQAAAGKVEDAMATLELGLAMRRQSNEQGVWGPIHHLLVSARVAAELGESALARQLLAELAPMMGRFTVGMTAMHARVGAVHGLLREQSAATMVHAPLTGRELAVLQLLQGSLSLHEISAELFLSANTVKTHASAVYRKLGAHSRADAVQNARRRSLI